VLSQGDRLLAIVADTQAAWRGPFATLAARLLSRRQQLAQTVAGFNLDSAADVKRIRVHGDYHLGQTLKTHNGFVLIDFEGEPSRSLEERRHKDCALRDVAGMMRSFDYAVAASAFLEPQRDAALRKMRAAFLDGYYGDGRVGSFLPARAQSQDLLTLFELEKAIYEVEYELNNRPEWIAIPLGAVLRLLGDPA
jgi:maltose alpha-D-glucosyltransferase/alpha-amylase